MIHKLEKVIDEIYVMEAKAPLLPTKFSTYFIKDGRGAVIEPGPASLIPDIHAALKQLGMENPEYIMPTHIHLDHGGAVGKLAELLPQATIVINNHGVKHMVDPSKLIRSTKMAFGDDFEASYGQIVPLPESRIRIVQDREKIRVGSRDLEIIYTPGHAPHHMSIMDLQTEGLFCGEALGLLFDKATEPLPAGAAPSLDLELSRKDREILAGLHPKILFYSHIGIGLNPELQIRQITANAEKVSNLILNALRAGRSEDQIVKEMGDFYRKNFNADLDDYDLITSMKGHIFYFNKMGMVQAAS
jgi:glyoxylase-like metal-dependent hydrolase (beta-lactamase superfamily II)